MTDYKQLCAELLCAMDEIEECEAVDWGLVKTQPLKMASQSMAQVRAALAEPEPKGPTDKELAELYRKSYYECETRQGDVAQVFALRTVLARWGK